MTLLAFLFESPGVVALGPALAALAVGYAAVGPDGRLYLTTLGEAYLVARG